MSEITDRLDEIPHTEQCGLTFGPGKTARAVCKCDDATHQRRLRALRAALAGRPDPQPDQGSTGATT